MLESLIGWDTQFFYWINQGWSHPVLDMVMPILRNKYTWIPLYLFIISFAIYNYQYKAWWFIFCGLLTVGIADSISSQVIKPGVERLRPCRSLPAGTVTLRAACGSGYSFTSSHAVNHFAIGTYFALSLSFLIGSWRVLFWIWALMIGVSQIYVGVHYPIDIFFGAILGISLGWLGFKVYHGVLKNQNLNYQDAVV